MSGNTVDLRGHEQVCTRKHAEQYAAFLGYEMMYFGCDSEPSNVDPVSFRSDDFVFNPLVEKGQMAVHTSSMLISKSEALNLTSSIEEVEMKDGNRTLTVVRDGYLPNGVRIHFVKEPGFDGNCVSNALIYSELPGV